MKNTQYESPIQGLLESLQTNFANTVNPKGSLEIEQLVVDGFVAYQAHKENDNGQKFATFEGTYLEYNPNKYDDACDIMETMQDLQPSQFVRWLTMVGYTVADARELLERELGGEQCYWEQDVESREIKKLSTGYSIKWDGYGGTKYSEFDDIGIDDHYYYVVPNGEYKWERTFETYREAKEYIGKDCWSSSTGFGLIALLNTPCDK